MKYMMVAGTIHTTGAITMAIGTGIMIIGTRVVMGTTKVVMNVRRWPRLSVENGVVRWIILISMRMVNRVAQMFIIRS